MRSLHDQLKNTICTTTSRQKYAEFIQIIECGHTQRALASQIQLHARQVLHLRDPHQFCDHFFFSFFFSFWAITLSIISVGTLQFYKRSSMILTNFAIIFFFFSFWAIKPNFVVASLIAIEKHLLQSPVLFDCRLTKQQLRFGLLPMIAYVRVQMFCAYFIFMTVLN